VTCLVKNLVENIQWSGKVRITKATLKEMIREELLKESAPIDDLEYSFQKTLVKLGIKAGKSL